MPNEPTIPTPRHTVVPLLVQRFARDFREAIKDYELPEQLELTEHLLFAVDLMLLQAHTNNEDIYSYYLELEDELLQKYRKAFKPYVVKQFFKYFWFDEVLVEKAIYSSEDFNRLPLDQQRLSLEEVTDFVNRCSELLYYARYMILLQMEPDTPQKPSQPPLPETAVPDKDITKARQLLAIYYLLKAGFDIEHRQSHDVSEVARFIHLLTGTKFTTLQNSDIYKKYRVMPDCYHNTGENLVKDLQFIRGYFEKLDMQGAVKLVNEEIDRTVKKLPLDKRKKYRG